MIWSSVDRSCLNAACCGVMCFLSSRCHMSLVLRGRSISFPTQLVRLTGRQPTAFDLSLPFFSIGIVMASLQTCGTISVLHPTLNSCKSFFLLRGPRCRSIFICYVVRTVGLLLDSSVVSASSSSLVTKEEFTTGSSSWSGPARCSSLTSVFLSVGTCRSLVSAYCLTRMLAAC